MAAFSISSSVVLLACFIVGFVASADTTNTRDALIKQLRERASPDSPPPDKDLPVSVKSEIKIVGINSLCPKLYHLKARAYEFYTWTDSRLAWSLTDFNVSYVTVHSADVWVPSMAIWQNAAENPTHDDSHHVFVLSTGEARFSGLALYKIACNGTAWEEYLKTTAKGGGGNTFKCAFVLGTGDYDSSVVDVAEPITASAQPTSDANGSTQQQQQQWMPMTASLQWYKPNAVYDVQSFDVKRRQMSFPLGTTMLNWSTLEFELMIKQKMPMSMSCPFAGMKGDKKKKQKNHQHSSVAEEDESDDEVVVASNGDRVPVLQQD